MPVSRREFIKTGVFAASVTLLSGVSELAQASTPDITHGARSIPHVALTFHGAGDPALVQKLLGILKETSTPISVFAIGSWLKGYPQVAKQMLDAGYDLGNHTMNHYQMKTLSAQVANKEIAECAAELKKLTGNHGKWFRPSGTHYSTAIIRKAAIKNGYKQCISYDVDSHDYQDVGKKIVLHDISTGIKNGSIVSMHFGHQDTIDAMPVLLENLHTRGLKPVTLTTLLGA
jgi:hypothetical protein